MWRYVIAAGTLVSIACCFMERKAREDAEYLMEEIWTEYEESVESKAEDLYEAFADRMDPDVRRWFERRQ